MRRKDRLRIAFRKLVFSKEVKERIAARDKWEKDSADSQIVLGGDKAND